MLSSQKHLFQLPDDIIYLNGAYMSPLLQSVEEAGIKGMTRKRNPVTIRPIDFFNQATDVQQTLGQLVNAAPQQMALIPSTSYGLKTAINNLPTNSGKYAITVSEEYPSSYYCIQSWCKQHGKSLKIIESPANRENRGKIWNEKLLEAIDNETAVVIMSSIHWTDGTKFDLEKIGRRCKEVNAFFIVDGTQSVGALPMDVTAFKIDALVCAGYKWLLAPYSAGFAYYSEYFNNGVPLEDSWLAKPHAEDFTSLAKYEDGYAPGAIRYHVGEFGNFILLPMLHTAVKQLLDWKVDAIQDYSRRLGQPLLQLLKEKNFGVEDENYRVNHILGLALPPNLNATKLVEQLQERKITVSRRGNSVRVSLHVYNTENDVAALSEILTSF